MSEALADKPSFQRYQVSFTAHIRDPKHNPRPAGVSARRMRVYNQLLYNNIESFLLACFPITRKILGSRRWGRLVREFLVTHKCQSPLFRQIPEEFVRFLQAREVGPQDPAFLAQFAHYEWIELVVDISPSEPEWERIEAEGDLMQGNPALNPALRVVEYPFQVHRIGPRYQPKVQDAEPTRIVVFRDNGDKVRFVVINVVTARLLALVAPGQCSGEQACERIAAELNHPNPTAVMGGGRNILDGLRQQGAVLGTWRKESSGMAGIAD